MEHPFSITGHLKPSSSNLTEPEHPEYLPAPYIFLVGYGVYRQWFPHPVRLVYVATFSVYFQRIGGYSVLALHLTITINIFYFRRLRGLEEEKAYANCTRLTADGDDFTEYDCQFPFNENKTMNHFEVIQEEIVFVGQPNITMDMSSYANATRNNITSLKDPIPRIALLNNSRLEVNGLNFTFTGHSNHPFVHGRDTVLLSFDEGEGHLKNATCKVLDRQNNSFTFDCYCEDSISAPLNGVMGVMVDGGDQVMIYMAEDETDWINTGTGINHQSLYKRGSSSGLSGGAIAAIVISFVVALIAIVIIAMMCRRKKNDAAPFQESTLGIVTNSISQ